MATFEELDALLFADEEQYYAQDLFVSVEDLIATLSDHDIPALLEVWQARGASWRGRFSQASASISQSVLVALLGAALASPTEPSTILELMDCLPRMADRSALSQSLVEFSAELWHAAPDVRRQIQMSTWRCGLSGRLLERLGLKSWQEAGL